MAKLGRVSDAVKHRFEEILESPSGYQKFKRIMAATKKEDTYLSYFKECMDRKFGKSQQFVDLTNSDDPDRPSTEALIQTISILRAELELARKGTGLAQEK